MQQDLTQGSIRAGLIRFSLPLIAGNLLQQLYNVADTLIVGRFLGNVALAAVGSAFSLMILLTSLVLGLCMGSGVVFSQLYGEGSTEKLKTAMTNAFCLIAALSLLLTALSYALLNAFISLLRVPQEAVPDITGYLLVIFAGIFFTFLYNFFAAVLRSVGNSLAPLLFLLLSTVVNIALDLLFVLVFHWGVSGAALATAVSPVLSIAICSRHFFKKSSTVRLVRQLPSPKLLAQSCQLGVSGFVGEMSSGVTTTVFNLLLLRLAGNVAVAAYGVVANYALVATAIFNGVAQGAQPLVSRCYGKNDAAGTRKLLLLGSGTALALAAALYAVLFGFTGPIVAVFNSENSALMAQYAFSGMRIYFLGYFFAGFNIVAAGYLGAVDRPAEASATSLSRGIVAIVACSLVLSALFGMNGVWAAFPASEAITACLTLYLLKRKKRTA